MGKIEIIIDNSLTKSLNLISNLLIRSLRFSRAYVILADDEKNVISNHAEPFNNVDFKNVFQDAILENKDNFSTDIHPFKELELNIKSSLIIPIVSSTGSIVGHLILLDTDERNLSDDEKSILAAFVDNIADVIENHIQNQQLQLIFTDFIHKTIHDLKNPLTSISLTTELLKRKADDAKMVNNLSDKLDKANKRLFSNLEELKSAFPIDDRSYKLDNTIVNLGKLLAHIKVETSNIDLQIEQSSDLNTYGDYNRLKEAIIQLINYIKPNPLTIKLHLEGNTAVISMISSQKTTKNLSSALAISKTLIQMHKGKIETIENGYAIYLPVETS